MLNIILFEWFLGIEAFRIFIVDFVKTKIL